MRLLNFPLIAVITTVIFWGSSYVAIRAALVDFSPGSIALLRYIIASVFIMPFYFGLSRRTRVRSHDLPGLFLLGAVGIGVYNVALNLGQVSVSSSMAGFIISQIPVVTILLATLFLKERLVLSGWIGLAVCIVGVCIIAVTVSQPGQFNHGVLYLLVAAACGGAYSVCQRPFLKHYKPVEVTAFAIWGGTIAMLGWSHHLVLDLHSASMASICWIVYLGIFPAVIAYSCWAYAMKHMPACKAASFLYWMPVVATILGWWLLGEVPELLSLLGGILALCGSMLIRVRK